MNEPRIPTVISRRQFLSMLGLTGAITVAPSVLLGDAGNAADGATRKRKSKSVGRAPTSSPSAAGKPVSGLRALVVIELLGGNDGFSMLVPSGDARFRQLRDRAWLDPKDMDRYDDRYSIAKGLAPLASQLAFVEGVGVGRPDLSHSAMQARWWQGDPDGAAPQRTGFLGRCCDVIGADVAIAGATIGGGSTPALISERAPTVALPDIDSLRELTKDDDERMRPTLARLTDGGTDIGGLEAADGDLMARARVGLSSALTLVGALGGVDGKAAGYPADNHLASSLSLVRELVALNTGIRVFHIPWGNFDTHTGQQWSHPEQMRQLGAALVAFHNDLTRTGLAQRVLVATTSEFGRRPEANAGGTDHGTASTMALMGPIHAGRHGAPVDFTHLDRSGNVAAPVSMADYYATLARWLGIPDGAVMAGGTVLGSLGI